MVHGVRSGNQLKKEYAGLSLAYELPQAHPLRGQLEAKRETVEKYLDESLVLSCAFTCFTVQVEECEGRERRRMG